MTLTQNKKLALAALLGVLAVGAGVVWTQLNAENPEVVQQMQQEEQLQDDFEAFLNTLPAPAEGSE
ncbi:MAG: hypothetical protein ACI81R_000724 [Bradymonadia bacterium]|jgi:uncharacterized protein HemX